MRTQHMEKSNENTHVGRFDAIRVFFALAGFTGNFCLHFPSGKVK